ncbi:tRNA pseudouridine synthase B [Enhygromyxa salina]|uniref:tRNA pseudouridine synthase B n=1 Tax=Enhygromyxa salina TaxID=215803 RepID=A0A0C1ZKV8_9BACT|nr:tRNA pseudouridine(55) synthase TruB [Enhygromyxa salina]KIG18164.1 tRNA pseudouridine synthase B [Enhygromyxa salina]
MANRKRRRSTEFGILLIDKPPGPTSFDVVGWVRWALNERTVGHCGTLDPPASGLLVVCVGEATKLVEHLTNDDKRYRARFALGRSTTTADAEGETLDTAEVPPGAEAEGAEILRALIGELELPPPAFSAVKLDGKRAHELARAGKDLDLPARPMALRSIEVLGHGRDGEGAWIEAELEVAKGTYVRSLAEEVGRQLGLPAHLATLRRVASGGLQVDDPRVVTGLVPVPLPEIEGRPPKWRVQFPSDGDAGGPDSDDQHDQRDLVGARLRSFMSDPWDRLPFPVSLLPDAGAHERLMTRMIQGQRLAASPSNCAALGLDDAEGLCVLVHRAAGLMMLVRCEPAERGSGRRFAPSRVLRFPPRPESTSGH